MFYVCSIYKILQMLPHVLHKNVEGNSHAHITSLGHFNISVSDFIHNRKILLQQNHVICIFYSFTLNTYIHTKTITLVFVFV